MSVKLKESCSNCANSKLKCTKDKPTCKRCARKSLTCEYLPCRRGHQQILNLDRPSSSTATDAVLLRESSIDSIDSGISLALSELQATLSNGSSGMSTVSPGRRTLAPAPPPATAPAPASAPPFPHSNSWEWMIASPLSSPPVVFPSGEHSSTHPQLTHIPSMAFNQHATDTQWPPSPVSTRSMSGLMTTPLEAQTAFIDTQVPRINTNEVLLQDISTNHFAQNFGPGTVPSYNDPKQHACLSVVTSMLERVYLNDNTPCTLQGPNQALEQAKLRSQSLGLHDVIAESRETIETLTPVMECACIQDELVVTLLPLVVLKILSSYSTAARRSLAGEINSSPVRSRTQSSENIMNLSPEIRPQGDRNQRRVAASHVLSEMHRVQRLVNSLSVRIQASRANAAADPAAAVLSQETFQRLEADMKSRIQAASGEIIEMLKGE